MKPRIRLVAGLALLAAFAALCVRLTQGSTVALLQPRGTIAAAQLRVLATSALLMLAVAVPILAALYLTAWRFRDGRGGAYDPERRASGATQLLLWALPALTVAALWVITWQSAHRLDPFNRIPSRITPVTIQVIALPWKWLFIYPEQGVASVNDVAFPARVPVHFVMTADAPMSSFWIPQLGSQMYVMAAMTTQLNLEAEPGTYDGKNTEINGDGFADMTFTARALSADEFAAWVEAARRSPATLDHEAFADLAAPSVANPPAYYASVPFDLFSETVTKYMPAGAMPGMDAPRRDDAMRDMAMPSH